MKWGQGSAVDIGYLNCHKAIDTIFYSLPSCKLRKMCWMKCALDGLKSELTFGLK